MAPTTTSLNTIGTCIGSNSNLTCNFDIGSRRYTFSQDSPAAESFPNFRSFYLTLSDAYKTDNDLSGVYGFRGDVGPTTLYLSLVNENRHQLLISGPINMVVYPSSPVHGRGTWSYADLD